MWRVSRRISQLHTLKVYPTRRPCRNFKVLHTMTADSSSSSGDCLDDPMFPRLVSSVLTVQTKLPENSVYTISRMLMRDKCTVPFLARYRQREMLPTAEFEVSAPMLFELQEQLDKWAALVKLRKSRLATLMNSEQPLDSAVASRLEHCLTRADLDEAYEGVKPSPRTTKVEAAKAVKGLENLASLLLNERAAGREVANQKLDTNGLSEILRKFKMRRDDTTLRCHLLNYLADQVAHSPVSVASAKHILLHRVRITASEAKSSSKSSTKSRSKENEKKASSKAEAANHQKYRDYFSFDRNLRAISSHQVLALRRGKDAGALKVSFTVEDNAIVALKSQLRYQFQVITKAEFHPSSILQWRNSLMGDVINDAVQRLITPMVTRLAWKTALEAADEEALGRSLRMFASNLRHLLLTPPLSQYLPSETSANSKSTNPVVVVCGVDPGFSNGHKIVILAFPLQVASLKPEVLCCTKLYTSSRNCTSQMSALIDKYKVQIVAIGNGVGSREAQSMTTSALKSLLDSATATPAGAVVAKSCRVAVVSEVGASVYSVSALADAEYPEREVSYRGAISIACRLVDPLREMVKIPPASLGVGMYQHDLKEAILTRRLGEVLEEIVSECGVDVNMASEEMLCYVSGLQRSRAKAIITHRDKNGGFRSREEIKGVKGIGETTFRNCAGFLRVYPPIRGGGSSSSDGDNLFNPLDATNVHPERYSLALSFLREVCRQLQKPSFDDRVIRQLLFSEELQSLLVDFSDSSWTTVAKACSTSQLPVDVSEIKQLGAWLSAAEFCGDAYFSSIASSKDPGSRGIRANRGQPPILKAISTLSAHASESEESSGIGGDSATRKSRKNKRDIDNNVNEDSETRNSSAKRLKIGLQVGDECLGTVRNVTAFGVFLDIGASRDGLLHTSEFLSNKFKKKAGKSIGGAIANSQSIPLVIGATVRVKVKSIDVERDRISLTQIDI